MNKMKQQKRALNRRVRDFVLRLLMYLCALIAGLLLVAMIGYICLLGIPHLSWNLISTSTSYLNDSIGILPNILNTLYIILTTMVIVVPIGICAAIYLTEYATNRRLVRLISFTVETLTGIPSIIFGMAGMLAFVQLLGLREGVMAGSLTLVVMVLPTIISNTQESLKTVPNSYREGALAMGSGKWHMIRTVVLPNSIDGIVTGCILAIGRITGESAALLFTAGIGLELNNYFHALTSSSATLTVALYLYAGEQGKFDVAFAIAVILMALTLLLNLAAKAAASKLKRKEA